ncbi:MAG: hypothetical protein J7K54_02575 [Candidatus Aenigmarchaeota archaeon]|nr:hypothetical protein [Candidatus Aenigmarchaeota archaeon]
MRKAYANIIYMSFLILIFIVIGVFILKSASNWQKSSTEIRINNIVYIMDDSALLAKLYLEESAKLSLYQAMYDLGKSGEIPGGNALWSDGSADSATGEAVLIQALADATTKNMEKYTKEYTGTFVFPAEIPFYRNVRIYPNGGSLRIVAHGDSPVTVKRISQTQDITIQRSSLINITVNAPFIELYRQLKDAAESARTKLEACNPGEINQKHETFCCTVETAIISSENGCVVNVTAVTKQKFPVYDNGKAVMKPITITTINQP